MRGWILASALSWMLFGLAALANGKEALLVGFSEADATPKVSKSDTVWLAGYGWNRRAIAIHDPIVARAAVLKHGGQKLAVVSIDLIGLQYHTIKQAQSQLPEFKLIVSSTHNHGGPDTIGLWGRTPLHRGVDADYLDLVVARIVTVVKQADEAAKPATAHFGTATDESLLADHRQPVVYDGVLRVLKFTPADASSPGSSPAGLPRGLIVQWNCHPEALGPKNRRLTADFPAATVAELKKQYKCPVVYISGTVGGLMSVPEGKIKDEKGNVLKEGDFALAEKYGAEVAGLAAKAIDAAKPIQLTPFRYSTAEVAIPLGNPLYRLARKLKVIEREGRHWSGDFHKLGKVILPDEEVKEVAVETEVSCLQLGALRVACIPGEIYPELVYGRFQEPVEPGADFPDAPLEPTVAKILGDGPWMLWGLANDEIGYIIPKRQWDRLAPFCYKRESSQYGEVNSCGPEVAPIIMQSLQERMSELAK